MSKKWLGIFILIGLIGGYILYAQDHFSLGIFKNQVIEQDTELVDLFRKRDQLIAQYIAGVMPLDLENKFIKSSHVRRFYSNYHDKFAPLENYTLLRIVLANEKFDELEEKTIFSPYFVEASVAAYKYLDCDSYRLTVTHHWEERYKDHDSIEVLEKDSREERERGYCNQINKNLREVVEKVIERGDDPRITWGEKAPQPLYRLARVARHLIEDEEFVKKFVKTTPNKELLLQTLKANLKMWELVYENWEKFPPSDRLSKETFPEGLKKGREQIEWIKNM